MDIGNRERRYNLIFRTLEFLGSVTCLSLAIVLITLYLNNHDKEPIFLLFTPSVIFTLVTIYDLIYYYRQKAVYTHNTWWPYATLAVILFFLAGGFLLHNVLNNEPANPKLTIPSLVLAFITGIIFLLDLIFMIYRYMKRDRSPVSQEERTRERREVYEPRITPRRSMRVVERSPEYEKCPPCTYLCEKTTSYHNIPVKKSSAMIQRRESRRAFREERILYPSPQVTHSPVRTEEKCTQSSKTSVCNCETRGGSCQQCKWIKYLLKAQQRSEKMTRERRASNVSRSKYAPDESESSSPVSSGNLLKPVVYQEQLTVKKPSKKVSSQYNGPHSIYEVETKKSVHNLQNAEIVKTYIQEQSISPRISNRQASRQNSIRSTHKPSYNQITSVIVHQEPSTTKENKYTQSNIIPSAKDEQTNTSQLEIKKSRPRRRSSQEEVAIQVIDYEKTRLQKISEVSMEQVTKSDAYNPGIPTIYVSDTADSDNSKRPPSSLSSPAPCKQTQYSNDRRCACAHKSPLDDAICVHCLKQWKKYQSTKSPDNEVAPPKTNEKRNGLDPEPSFRERVSQATQIRQASALFHYISPRSNTSPPTSQLNSPTSAQPQKPNSHRLVVTKQNIRSSSRSEPPKVLCTCKENVDPGCKMHGTKSKLTSLPASASRRGRNFPQTTHATQTKVKKDRYKTSP